MARYRQVDTRVWTDRKFTSLSDDGRQLWLFLLTSPFALPIPGVMVAGEMATAEMLGWTTKRLGIGYGELHTKGLSILREGRVVWLSKAFEYQKIAGPKHITSMVKHWDDIPDGNLKIAIWEALKTACKTWDKLFAKGFPIPLRSSIGYPITQEQEQEQEQETEKESGSASPKRLAHQLPDDWSPARSALNLEAESEALARGVVLRVELLKLRDWAKDSGKPGKDWDARWRNWIRNAGPSRNGAGKTSAEMQMERVRMLEAEEAAARGGP